MLADVDDKVRTVRLELDRPDYDRAIGAHKADLQIRAIGTLERAGTIRELTDPTSFAVVGA